MVLLFYFIHALLCDGLVNSFGQIILVISLFLIEVFHSGMPFHRDSENLEDFLNLVENSYDVILKLKI